MLWLRYDGQGALVNLSTGIAALQVGVVHAYDRPIAVADRKNCVRHILRQRLVACSMTPLFPIHFGTKTRSSTSCT